MTNSNLMTQEIESIRKKALLAIYDRTLSDAAADNIVAVCNEELKNLGYDNWIPCRTSLWLRYKHILKK